MSIYTITGGAGFIGSHLADALLAAGHHVRVLDDFSTGRPENLDSRCEVMRGDICDPGLVRRAMLGAAGCFHLAAIASVARANEDWLGTHRVNLGGTITVLDAARHLGGVPVVYASSAAVYGRLDGVAAEDSATAPLTAYGADKRASELHAAAGTLVHDVPTLGFRFFNIYGPRQDPTSPYSGVISIFARLIAAGQTVTVNGDGRQTRDLIFVGDIVRFLTAGMDRLTAGGHGVSGTVLNACTGRETSVLDMARLIGELIGTEVRMRHGPPRPGDIPRSVGSPARAAARLGVAAQTGLREGLAATLAGLHGRTSLAA
ncbi:MAG: NAD-dependent epimerase/dehydratase family protein [Acetobacteraceae bacterium]|nr:NAD-dependent epimerase/dehydratase family protein [Acetobacteraceae bacterium]